MVEDPGDVAGLDQVVDWRGDCGCEDSEGVFLDEAAEGGEGGFGVGGAEVHVGSLSMFYFLFCFFLLTFIV